MRRLIAILIVLTAAAGCSSADIRRVAFLEEEVGRLQSEVAQACEWGVDPSKVEIPEELGYEIDSLSVYPPVLETAVSIFPGFLFPGLGAHAIGDYGTGWCRLGEAYTGVGEFAMGTGLTALSIAAACESNGNGDGVAEAFVYGVGNMVMGPVHYLEAWFGDVASTYGSRKYLAGRVQALKNRYMKFLIDYEQACRSYRLGR